jgi:anaerobic selenocysteine-containing dehydrogenase
MSDNLEIHHSTCPHDCPSVCSLEVELLDAQTIGRVRGARDNTYTDGVVCEKVARYAERIHHPDRLLYPLKCSGPKGSGTFERISWEQAMAETAAALLKAEAEFGAESVWPYFYAGTMGHVMRDGIERLRHAKKYSGQHSTVCVTLSQAGFLAGTGRLAGPDPREIADADVVVIWGTNPVHTQVNLMSHVIKARKKNATKIVVVDVYQNPTMAQADMGLCVNPGSDGALACAVMHILFRENYADRDFLAKFSDYPIEFEQHLKDKTPQWAAGICGLTVEEIEAFATLLGTHKRSYLRLGYGFTRSRNGAVNMHAAASIATVMGSWQHKGGGAFHGNNHIYHWDKSLIEGLDVRDNKVRMLDQSRIGPILAHDPADIGEGPPVKALFIQNTNPMVIAPEQDKVRQGFEREDLFVCVHEQFMTETAKMADIVLPATMFLEHDDHYQAGGHQHISLGPKIIEAPGECRSNHEVICDLARRVGAEHPGFDMTSREITAKTLENSGWKSLEALDNEHWFDCQPDFDTAHYINGFAHEDGKFKFKPDWNSLSPLRPGGMGPIESMPEFPDYWDVIEKADEAHPFRLVTAPSRGFLNTSFNETPTSVQRQGRPTALMHSDDAAHLNIAEGAEVVLGNQRGQVSLHVSIFDGVNCGVIIVEGLHPNHAFIDGKGINTLTSADIAAPNGGAPFHDTHIWVRPK